MIVCGAELVVCPRFVTSYGRHHASGFHVGICLSADSRDAVDDVVGKAQGAGGGADPGPKQDYGFMYGRSFEDPDGHHWEVMWMDVAAAQSAMAQA